MVIFVILLLIIALELRFRNELLINEFSLAKIPFPLAKENSTILKVGGDVMENMDSAPKQNQSFPKTNENNVSKDTKEVPKRRTIKTIFGFEKKSESNSTITPPIMDPRVQPTMVPKEYLDEAQKKCQQAEKEAQYYKGHFEGFQQGVAMSKQSTEAALLANNEKQVTHLESISNGIQQINIGMGNLSTNIAKIGADMNTGIAKISKDIVDLPKTLAKYVENNPSAFRKGFANGMSAGKSTAIQAGTTVVCTGAAIAAPVIMKEYFGSAELPKADQDLFTPTFKRSRAQIEQRMRRSPQVSLTPFAKNPAPRSQNPFGSPFYPKPYENKNKK